MMLNWLTQLFIAEISVKNPLASIQFAYQNGVHDAEVTWNLAVV